MGIYAWTRGGISRPILLFSFFIHKPMHDKGCSSGKPFSYFVKASLKGRFCMLLVVSVKFILIVTC